MVKSFVSKYKAVIFIGVIIIWGVLENYLNQEPYYHFQTVPIHQVVDMNRLSKAWVRDNVYVGDSSHQKMVAYQGLIIFIGGIDINDRSNITTLDALTGNVKWQITYGYSDALFVSDAGLFIGQGGGVKIVKYDPFEREYEWHTDLPGTRGLANMFGVSNEIYIWTTATTDKFFILDAETGEIIQQSKGYVNFLNIDAVTYQRSITSNEFELEAIDINSQELIWNVKLNRPFDVSPMYTEKEIFALTGDGGIYCIERETGSVKWYNEITSISNLVLAKNEIYFISRYGQLQGLDIQTGEITEFVQFDTEKFVLNGETFVGGYYVAYDKQTNMLFAQLGDSAQLFAFQLGNE